MFVDFEDMHAALTLKVMKVVRKTICMSRVVGACWLMSVTLGVHANAQESSGVSVDLQSSVPAPNRLVPASASTSTLDPGSAPTLDSASSTSLAHISSSDAIQASSSDPDLTLGANSQSAPVLAPVTNLASDSATQDLISDQAEVAPNAPLALESDSTKQALHQQRLSMAQVWFDAALASVKFGLSSDVNSDENSSSTLPSSSSLAVISSSVTPSALGLGDCAHALRPYNSLFKRMVAKSMKKDWGIGADATQKAWANDSAVKSIPSAATPVIDTVRSAFNQASTGKVGLHTAQALEQVTSPADANYVATDGVAANQTATNNNIAANSTAKTEIKLGYPQNLRQMQRNMTLSQALVQQQQWYKPRRCAICQKLYDIRFLAYLTVPFQKASKITALAHVQTPQDLCLFFVQTLMHQVKPMPAYNLSLSQALQINKSNFDSTRKVLENYKDILKEQIYLDLTSYRRNRDYVDNESLRFGVEVRPHDLPLGFARLHSPIALALQNAFNVAPMAQAADTVETIAAATLSTALESDKTLSNADAASGQDSTSSPESNLTSDADTVSSSGSTTGADAVLPSDADSSPTKGSDASLTLVSNSVSTSGSASAPTSSSNLVSTSSSEVTATHADPIAVAADSSSADSDSQPKSAVGFGLAEHDVAVAVSVFVPSMAPEAQGKICDKFKALVHPALEASVKNVDQGGVKFKAPDNGVNTVWIAPSQAIPPSESESSILIQEQDQVALALADPQASELLCRARNTQINSKLYDEQALAQTVAHIPTQVLAQEQLPAPKAQVSMAQSKVEVKLNPQSLESGAADLLSSDSDSDSGAVSSSNSSSDSHLVANAYLPLASYSTPGSASGANASLSANSTSAPSLDLNSGLASRANQDRALPAAFYQAPPSSSQASASQRRQSLDRGALRELLTEQVQDLQHEQTQGKLNHISTNRAALRQLMAQEDEFRALADKMHTQNQGGHSLQTDESYASNSDLKEHVYKQSEPSAAALGSDVTDKVRLKTEVISVNNARQAALVPEINESTREQVSGKHSFDQAFKHYKPRIRKDFKDEIEHVDNLNRAWDSLTNQAQNSADQSTAQQAQIEVSPAKVNEINEAIESHAPNEAAHKGSVTAQQSSSYAQSKLGSQTNAQAIESALVRDAEPNLTQAATLAQPQPQDQVKSQAHVNHAAYAHENEQNLEQAKDKANLKQLPQDQSHLDLQGEHDAMSQPINGLTVESNLRRENGFKTYSNHALKYDEREAILSKTQMQEHIAQQRRLYIEQVKTGLAQNIVLIPLYQEYEMHDLLTELDADLFSSTIFREPLQATQQGDAQATDKVRKEILQQYQDLGHDINAVLGQQAARETETVNHAKIKTFSHDGTVGAKSDAAADSKFEFKLQPGLAAKGESLPPSLVDGELAVSLNARMSTDVDDKASRYLASAGENNQDNLSANGVEQLKSGFESKSGYSTFLENMFKSSWPYANGIEVLPGVAFNEGNAERLKSKVQSHRPIKPLDGKHSSAVGQAVGNAADANLSLDAALGSESTDYAQNKALENVRNNVLVDTRPKLPRYLPRQAINMESLREYDSRIWPKTLFSFDSTGHIFTHSMMHNTKLIPNRHQMAMRSLKNKQWLHWLDHLSQPSSYEQPWGGRTKCLDPGVTGLGALYANVKPQQRQIDMDDSRSFWSTMYRLVWTEQVKDYDDAVFIQGVNDVPYSKQQQEDMRLSLNEWDKVFDSSFFLDENADLFFTEKQLTQMQSLYDLHQHRLTSQPAWFGEEFKFSSLPSLNLSSSANSSSSAHGLRSGFSSQLSSSVLADDKSLQPGSSSIATKCAMDLINIPGYEQNSYNTPGDAQASGYLDTPASSVVNFIRMCKPQASQ